MTISGIFHVFNLGHGIPQDVDPSHAGVITSYSIHYTKLYEPFSHMPERIADWAAHFAPHQALQLTAEGLGPLATLPECA